MTATAIAAVILAAGDGGRVGTPKLRLRIGDETYLARIVRTVTEAGVAPIIAVVQQQFADWATHAFRQVITVTIADSDAPMIESLRAGIARVNDDTSVVVVPVDHPFVTAETYRLLVQSALADPTAVVKPTHKNFSGHPIVIPPGIVRRVRQAAEGETLRDLIRTSGVRQQPVRVEDEGVVRNINAMDDLNLSELS